MIRKIKTERKLRLHEAYTVPCEGIFWLIDDELIAYPEQVDSKGLWSTTLEHIKIWNHIKHKYNVDGKTIDYDYFPRGRVVVNAISDNGVLHHYDAYIYIDNCINTDEVLDMIKQEFNLFNCKLKYIGSEGGIMSDHYKCHNCKDF